ncbi:HEAT repeat domain-containing protein [Rubrivirga sp. IMCC43871]|uniref:HEAT repeat domain-containing protein n=1 Tax=Rubrivirga sp. IMCC43871 TaxID=3391575 RepID=UPI00398FEFC1
MDDFADLYAQYKELILIAATAVATLLATKLLPWLGKAMSAGAQKVWGHLATGQERTSFEERYRRYVAEENRYLQVAGIKTRTQVSIELDRVYVGLELKRRAVLPSMSSLRRVGSQYQPLTPEEMAAVGAPDDASDDLIGSLGANSLEPSDRTYEVGEALRGIDDRIVILGAPGSGKSTLVKYLAVTFAERKGQERLDVSSDLLPILIPLRDWVKGNHQLEPDTLGEYVLGPTLKKECPASFFRNALGAGRCLVLLDGMDEVSSDAERAEAASQIDRLVAAFPNNHYVVTSRPAGYEGVSLSGFTVLRVRDFSDKDVESFARQWAMAVEVASRGATEADEVVWEVAREVAEEQAEDLVRAIREKDRVRQLAVNPLLLTIVALVHRYRAVLPDRRVELYDECVQVLLNYWDAAKGIAGQMEWRQKRRVLEELALAMHQRETTWLTRAEVEDRLRAALPSVGEKPEEAEAFLDDIRTRSGLLVERGVNEFGFSHLTFQEYLAALALRRQGDAGRAFLIERLDDAWWKEVLLLYAGLDQATDLVRELLRQERGLFLSPLFTAAEVLADAVEVAPTEVEQVVDELIREWLWGGYQTRQGLARGALIKVGGSWPYAVGRLRSLLRDKSGDAQQGVASILGRLGEAAAPAVGDLRALLRDESEGVRQSAAYALGLLGEVAAPALDDLLALLRDESEGVRRSASFALGGLGEAAAPAMGDLLVMLGDESEGVRQSAAYALGELGKAVSLPVAILLVLLGDESESVRQSAAHALGGLGEAAAPAVGDLRALLRDESEGVRQSAAYALGLLGKAAAPAVGDLRALLRDESEGARQSAAYALGELGEAAAPAVGDLRALLRDESEGARQSAAYALGELGEAAAPAVGDLRALLRDESEGVRRSATSALGGLGEAAAPAVGDLRALLRDESEGVRQLAAFALGRLGEVAVRTLDDLLALLRDESEGVRQSAAYALGLLGKAAAPAVGDLRALLRDESEGVRQSAAYALGGLGEVAAPAVDDLMDLLRDESKAVRQSAAYALRQVGETQEKAARALIAAFISLDGSVSAPAAAALAPSIFEERPTQIPPPGTKEALIGLLESGRLVENPSGPDVRVRDVAWDLLYALHQQDAGSRDLAASPQPQ